MNIDLTTLILMLLFLILVIAIIGYLFKLNDKMKNSNEEIIVNRNNELSKINYTNNFLKKFEFFIEDVKKDLQNFDQLDTSQSMREIKERNTRRLNEYMNTNIFNEVSKKDANNEIIIICNRMKKESPSTWLKKFGKDFERIINEIRK